MPGVSFSTDLCLALPGFFYSFKAARRAACSLSKNPGVDKGPQPLMFNPALTTCASERMKNQRFSYFAGFAARERMREAKPVKLKKVAFSHFFDTLKAALRAACFSYSCIILALRLPHSAVSMAKVRGAPPRGQEGLPGLIMYSLPS